jgi:hypothetical protein
MVSHGPVKQRGASTIEERTMSSPFIRLCSIALILTCLSIPFPSRAISMSNPSATGPAERTTVRDGQHDFDFDLGTWKTHSSRLLYPLTGSTTWTDSDGVTVVKKIWDGRANLDEYKAEGPSGHVELLSLRWYTPGAHQWNLAFSTPNVGKLGVPGIGEFKNGRGDFYNQEEINGKYVLVRFSIWSITPDAAQSEQALSDDGGKTWEVNCINKYTRINDQTQIDLNAQPSGAGQAAKHDFDFNIGAWRTHITATLNPFSSSPESIELNGTVAIREIWGGRAQLEEIEADGPKGHWEALSLFLYNPQSHQWNQTFIDSSKGDLNPPLVGVFKDGRGELFSEDTFNDRSILVRAIWGDITPNSHRYEESFSNDGGKTWRAAFIATLTREK